MATRPTPPMAQGKRGLPQQPQMPQRTQGKGALQQQGQMPQMEQGKGALQQQGPVTPFAFQQMLRQQMMAQWMQMQTPRPHSHGKGGQPMENQTATLHAFHGNGGQQAGNKEQTNKERKLLWYKQALEKGKGKGGKKGGKGKGKPPTTYAERQQLENPQEQQQTGNPREQNTEETSEEACEDTPKSPSSNDQQKGWWEDSE